MANFQQFPHKTNSNNSSAALSSWSRQQKIAMIAGFVILGLLIAMSACSTQAAKPALVGISSPEPQSPAAVPAPPAPAPVTPETKKKAQKKRPAAIVTYKDAKTGVSFRYPRKYELAGNKVQPEIEGLGPVPMNFAQPGGSAVATVAVPAASYPNTDLTTAFFHVNVNRSLSEQECSEFSFVDARNPDGEPVEAERLRVGSATMEKTSNFSGDALKQGETQYYHRYDSGACYEFVLGLGTAGYGTEDGLEAVNRDEVFAKLEKILASVKIEPVEPVQQVVATTPAATEETAK